MVGIIAIANQKGGVGKTTTAINLAAALANKGQGSLLIDMDPQGNTSSGLGFDKKTMEDTIYGVLIGDTPIEKTIKQTKIEYLDIICSNSDLIGAEIELVSTASRETRLRQVLQRIDEMYRFIVIDCPPSLGLLTINVMAAVNSVIIPIQSEYYALEGLANFMETLDKIKAALNPSLALEGILLTMFDSRITLANQVRGEIEKHFPNALFNTTIPRNVRLAEAPGFGQSIFQYDPRSKGAEAYLSLAAEVLQKKAGIAAEPPVDAGGVEGGMEPTSSGRT